MPTYSIEGEIRLPDNGLADQGNIIVWNMDENSPYPIWWYKPLEGAESFKFVNLPQVNFTLRFDPDEASYPGYLKTYLGDTPYMEDAVVYLLDQDIDEVVIHLLEAPLPGPGTGVVSGSLFEEGGKKTGLKLKSGNYDGDGVPLENVSVYLCDMAGEITHSDVSDSNGEFDFVSISQGNYLLKVDYNAIPMDDQNDTLKVTEENQEFEILAIISESKISCGITNLSTSTGIWESVNLNVYPNPFADKLYLELNTFNNEDLIFEVYDLSGRCILNGIRKRSSFPEEKFQLDTKKLKEGYYLMKLRLGEQEFNLKLLKIR